VADYGKKRAGFGYGLRLGAVAAVAASAVVAVFYWLAASAFGVTFTTTGPGGPDQIDMVWAVLTTALAALCAPAVLALCLRLSPERGARLFRWSALAVLLLSLLAPWLADGADASTRWALTVLHAAAAAVTVGIVRPRATPGQTSAPDRPPAPHRG
jgi:hypothetical protein